LLYQYLIIPSESNNEHSAIEQLLSLQFHFFVSTYKKRLLLSLSHWMLFIEIDETRRSLREERAMSLEWSSGGRISGDRNRRSKVFMIRRLTEVKEIVHKNRHNWPSRKRNLEEDDFYLVGTSEVPLAAYHMDEILETLPIRYAGYSPCFRREAGTYGKDTRGIIRVHQFEKVEMFSFCKPEDAQAEHKKLLQWEKDFFDAMELPYRVIDVASGDLGASAIRKFDIEAWIPTQDAYREVTSTSNCTEFQSRRLNIRYRDENGTKPVVGFIAGETAPKGRTMGHAGAIVGGTDDTAEAKKRIMKECGIHVVDSPAQIGAKMAEVLGKA
jgi:hypothetical protein